MANASRRGVLAVLATAPVSAVARPIAADAANPVLARLIVEHDQAEAAYLAASEAQEVAWQRYQDLGGFPVRPEATYARPGDVDFCIYASGADRNTDRRFFTDDFIEHLRRQPRTRGVIRYTTEKPGGRLDEHHEPTRISDGVIEYGIRHSEVWPEAQSRAMEIVAAHDERVTENCRRREVSGYEAADQSIDACAIVANRALHAVIKAKVVTLADVVAKAGILVGLNASIDEMEVSIDLDDDLEAGGALHVVVDLYRLAGCAS